MANRQEIIIEFKDVDEILKPRGSRAQLVSNSLQAEALYKAQSAT